MKKFDEARVEWMKEYLTSVIRSCNGNMAEAARVAGKNRTDFYKLCDRAGISRTKRAPGRKEYGGNEAWKQLGSEQHG